MDEQFYTSTQRVVIELERDAAAGVTRTNGEIADIADCSPHTVRRIRNEWRRGEHSTKEDRAAGKAYPPYYEPTTCPVCGTRYTKPHVMGCEELPRIMRDRVQGVHRPIEKPADMPVPEVGGQPE